MPEVPSKYQPIICPQCGAMGMPNKNWACKCGKYTYTVASLEQEVSKDNRIASGWLLWVDEREADMKQHREEIIYASAGHLSPAGVTVIGKGQRASMVPGKTWEVPYISTKPSSDTTGNRGTILGDLQDCEEWISLIREVEKRLPWKMQIFLLLRRECRHNVGRKGWVAYVQYHYCHKVAQRLKKKPEETWIESRNTFTAWWQRIVTYTVVIASKRGLL